MTRRMCRYVTMSRWCVAGLVLSVLCAASACERATADRAKATRASHGAEDGHTAEAATAQARSAETPDPHAGHRSSMPTASGKPLPPGYATITVDQARATGMGLATASVEQRAFQRTIRTTGLVSLDETRTSHVHSKVRGWIENVSANFVGKTVKAGTPLCTVYSQEVYSAQLEFLSVLDQTARSSSAGPFADAERSATGRLLQAARRRLSFWDVPAAEIERLEQTRQPRRTFALVAPRSGIVVSKQALAGMFIDPDTELYVVSDVSKLWLLADVYAADVPWMRIGAPASLSIEGLESEPLQGTISFLPPTIEESTRTLKVRFDLDNQDGRIRPGAFATVEMGVDLGSALAIPESAVIHAGERAIVFVVEGNELEPRAVDLGPMVDGYYRVARGVSAGEAVAVGAQFLIDSESRLRATSTPGAQHAGH
jgi:membrane fusion protein, copper/silver efflux system